MAFTRIKDDEVRIKKYLQESTEQGQYMISVPGNGLAPDYIEDPHSRLEKWGANLADNAIDLESDLRGLTRQLNRDEVSKGVHNGHSVDVEDRQYSKVNNKGTEQSRATHPAWWHREEQQYRSENLLFSDPQDLSLIHI